MRAVGDLHPGGGLARARGRFALADPRGRLRPWLAEILTAGAARIGSAPIRPAAADPIRLLLSPTSHRQAA